MFKYSFVFLPLKSSNGDLISLSSPVLILLLVPIGFNIFIILISMPVNLTHIASYCCTYTQFYCTTSCPSIYLFLSLVMVPTLNQISNLWLRLLCWLAWIWLIWHYFNIAFLSQNQRHSGINHIFLGNRRISFIYLISIFNKKLAKNNNVKKNACEF